ncbi:MMPL family transporter [Williamsia muralis]|uniref:MMPL family transporter n=1 Tax=Williamsia marianensis TaxID=85044 RepID=A0ABU4ESJ3_WILMA|nr:MMPL family transporter [Williamsia muralis]MDV7134220.1 MMPL family transporter [Williamsia muralis]
MLSSLARGVIAAPKRVLAGALLLLIICGVLGSSVSGHLAAGGFQDPDSESAKAIEVMSDTFERGGLQVVIRLHESGTPNIADSDTARTAADAVVRELESLSFVERPIISAWNNPEAAAALISEDRTSGLITFTVAGGDKDAAGNGKKIEERFSAPSFASQFPGIDILVGGQAMVYSQVNEQTSRDLFVAEAVAIPISFLLLIWVFGGLTAAVLPLAIGIFAIIGTTAVLRGFTLFADVSVFALNLTTAMGLALAIDYTLLIINRYREEVQAGRDQDDALVVTVATAGRTVLFSAVTVAFSLAAMAIFPMYFLRSFAYAGLAVVALAAAAALVVAPALIAVLGPRIDSLDVRRPIRRLLGRDEPHVPEPEESMWYRSTQFVLRHAVPVGLAVVALLLVLGAPFLGIKFGYPDDRVLPESASARVLGDELREDYSQNASASVNIVIPEARDLDESTMSRYGQDLSQVADVTAVTTPVGTFVDGQRVGNGGNDMTADNAAYLTVSSTVDPFSERGQDQLDALRAVPAPAETLFSGLAQQNIDNVNSIIDHLPEVFVVIVVTTFILLFLLTGSVLLPVKALVLNVFSLTATFGAMVWIFQDGNLGGLGSTTTGTLIANMPVLMFCIAFGLSMDYEVFLLSRIREEWLKSGRTRADNDHAVAYGLARTGRVVTAAALLMAIVFAGIAFSQVSFMRMFGVGLALAVLMDATLIRMFLVPAFMKIAGRANWWAPAPLRKFHDRFGLSEEGGHDSRATEAPQVPSRLG